jgi:hypothetical protein
VTEESGRGSVWGTGGQGPREAMKQALALGLERLGLQHPILDVLDVGSLYATAAKVIGTSNPTKPKIVSSFQSSHLMIIIYKLF